MSFLYRRLNRPVVTLLPSSPATADDERPTICGPAPKKGAIPRLAEIHYEERPPQLTIAHET